MTELEDQDGVQGRIQEKNHRHRFFQRLKEAQYGYGGHGEAEAREPHDKAGQEQGKGGLKIEIHQPSRNREWTRS